jgi:hypothetical protein
MASTQLMPISPKDYRNLLGELEKLLPDSLTVSFLARNLSNVKLRSIIWQPYNWILNHLKWIEKIPELKVQILCPNGDWKSCILVALADGLAVNFPFKI